jgi:hypothetical protein
MPPLADYPDSAGAHKVSVFAHTGPVLYAALTANPVAGGDTVQAVEAGMKFFDAVLPVGFTDSGLYYVQGVAPAANPSTNKQAAHAPTWKLKWIVTSTGVEAAAIDLSAQTVRLFAIGRY